MKENLLISFSGGETSAYMAWFINKYWKDKFNLLFVFANTGEEHEETLKFIDKCSKEFGIDIYWVEAVINEKGTTSKVVDFKTAARSGQPFEEMIKKYGIPNQSYKHCNRELKLQPINHFVKEVIGWEDYYTAIGIRNDEIDRVRSNYRELNLLYPLVTEIPMSKRKINFWWNQQKFRLNLKGYQGNCKTCWKKSDKKLRQIARENPEWYNNFRDWEKKYEDFIPENQNRPEDKLIRFFRNHRSVEDIFKESKIFLDKVIDDHKETSYQTSLLDQEESCDIYAECG